VLKVSLRHVDDEICACRLARKKRKAAFLRFSHTFGFRLSRFAHGQWQTMLCDGLPHYHTAVLPNPVVVCSSPLFF
jgi:hypothetical protein